MKNIADFKVLLVYPNLSMMRIPSLAIGLFTSILKSKGYIVGLFDATPYKDEAKILDHENRRIESLQYRKVDTSHIEGEIKTDLKGDFIRKISDFKPDILIISVVEDTFEKAVNLIDWVQEFKIPNIIGGVFPSMSPEEAITPTAVNMIAIGEGEETAVDVCEMIRKGESCENVSGVWFKKENGSVVKNPYRSLVDINKNAPDYTLFEKDKFYRPWGGKIYKTITLETVRGCPYKCTFCNTPAREFLVKDSDQTSYIRRKDIDRVDYELSLMKESVDPEFIMFVDDTFLTRPEKNFYEWCEMYEKHKIPFWVNTRLESISEEKLNALRQVGCHRFSFSIEHGNQEYRKKFLEKAFKNEDVVEKGQMVANCGIPFSMDVLIGLPFETRELVFDTIELVRKIPGYDALTVNIFTPYRGTKLRDLAIKKGWLDKYIFSNGISGSSMLRMPLPYLQQTDIEGLFRTFALYAYYPKERWGEIKAAESLSEEGNLMFKDLSSEYYNKRFSNVATVVDVDNNQRGVGCRADETSSL